MLAMKDRESVRVSVKDEKSDDDDMVYGVEGRGFYRRDGFYGSWKGLLVGIEEKEIS